MYGHVLPAVDYLSGKLLLNSVRINTTLLYLHKLFLIKIYFKHGTDLCVWVQLNVQINTL